MDQRIARDLAALLQKAAGERKRDIAAGDRGRARAAIGLQHIAIDLDLQFAEFFAIDHRAQTAADQALDFLRAARLLALGGFAVGAFMGRARQHAVLGGDPAEACVAQKGRHFFIEARGAQHMRLAELHEARTFGIFGGTRHEGDGAQLAGSTIGETHEVKGSGVRG